MCPTKRIGENIVSVREMARIPNTEVLFERRISLVYEERVIKGECTYLTETTCYPDMTSELMARTRMCLESREVASVAMCPHVVSLSVRLLEESHSAARCGNTNNLYML